MSKGVYFGFQYLEEGEYTINGGKGNKVLSEVKVEDGVLYIKEGDNWIIPIPPSIKKDKN